MPNWKASRYNITTDYKDQFYIVHNLLSDHGVMIDADKIDDLRTVLKKPDLHQEHPLFSTLVDRGLLLDAQIDEDDLIAARKTTMLAKNQGVLALTLIPTYQCNFKCVYCWEDTKDTNDSMKPEAQRRLLAYIDSQLPNSSTLNLTWFGGEPLMAFKVIKNLSEQIDILCKKYRVPYFASITTNGYLLTLDRFKFLHDHNTRFFQVTLDGPAELHDKNRPLKTHGKGKFKLPVLNGAEPHQHDAGDGSCSDHTKVKPPGTFERVLNNLREIRDHAKGTFRFIVRLNVTEETRAHSGAFLNLVQAEFAHDKRFRLYMQAVEGHDGVREEEMEGNYLSVHDKLMEDLFDESISKGIMTSTLRFSKPGDLMCGTRQPNSFFVNSDGRFYKCDMEMRQDHQTFAGELDENGTLQTHETNLREWEKVDPPDYCNKCVLQPMCFGLKCPYYNSLKAETRCELFNSHSFARCAVKTYAQEGKYELTKIP